MNIFFRIFTITLLRPQGPFIKKNNFWKKNFKTIEIQQIRILLRYQNFPFKGIDFIFGNMGRGNNYWILDCKIFPINFCLKMRKDRYSETKMKSFTIPQKNKQLKETKTCISNSYLIRQSFQGYRCKSGIDIFAWRVIWNYAYSLFKI